MINKIAYELVNHLATNIPFFDKWAGLVKPLRKKVQAADKVFPVAINTPSNCDQSDYTALVPDSNKRSIAYVEQIGETKIITENHGVRQMSANLCLVVWYNLDKITGGELLSEDALVDEVLTNLPRRLSDSLFNGAKQVHVNTEGIIYGTDIMNKYTYKEIKTQFGMHPYGVFAIMLEVWYLTTHCQIAINPTDGCISGKGSYQSEIL